MLQEIKEGKNHYESGYEGSFRKRKRNLTQTLKWILASRGIPGAKMNKKPEMDLNTSWWYSKEMFLSK